MESTGDATLASPAEVALLFAALVVVMAVAVVAAGSMATADNRPPCASGNYVGGTCTPDESGTH